MAVMQRAPEAPLPLLLRPKQRGDHGILVAGRGGSCNALVLCAPQEIQQLREVRNWPEWLPRLSSATWENLKAIAGAAGTP